MKKEFKNLYGKKVIAFINELKKDRKKIFDFIFVCFVFLFLFFGLFRTIIIPKDINYYENRMAYRIPRLSISTFIGKEYQDNVEKAFSNQIPLSTTMKKAYNFENNGIAYFAMKNFFDDDYNGRYIRLSNSTTIYGNNIVYLPMYIEYSKDLYDNRVEDINKSIKNNNVDTYIYYVEKDTDIDFETGKKTGIYEYLKKNIDSDKIYRFEINSYEDFEKYFYKTDHHWNYKGSYKAYSELVSILTADEPLKYNDELCINDNFSGSKANFSGASYFFKEKFCVYFFDFPKFDIYINGELEDYGNQVDYISGSFDSVSYASFYGSDDGEIIFDSHRQEKDNILVIGESYDNAILKLLASHFNKTYSVDLRNYTRETGKKFNYSKYISDNNIDKVLLIGNIDYFKMEEFNLEV